MESSLKRLRSVGERRIVDKFFGWLLVEDLVYEIKQERCFRQIVPSSQEAHFFLFSASLCVFGLQRQIYSHPRSCITAIYLSSSLPIDIYSARFLDDSQDGALSREHSLCLIWVSGLRSPGGHKEEQNR